MSRLEVKKVQLSDKTWMDAYLDEKQDKGCDMCFANIYLWGRKYKTGYAMVNDCLIFADLTDFNSVSMPLGEPEKVKQAILTLEEYFAEDGKPFALHLTTPKNVEQLEEWFPGTYQVEYERDLADYAEVVLYMMMQRGVFSVSLYSALIAAYPESFEKLSAQEQTKIMEKIQLSAYELETAGTAFIASEEMAEVFAEGKTEEPKEILEAMFAIAQGRGKGKDRGIFCKKKALGYTCENPIFESCLANLCPYHVFTSDGVPTLVNVFKDYQLKARMTGNKKYSIALKTKIIPAFQDIINAIIKDMTDQEKAGTKRLIEEALNG